MCKYFVKKNTFFCILFGGFKKMCTFAVAKEKEVMTS